MPKSKARKTKIKRTPLQRTVEPHDPALGEILTGRGWRLLTKEEIGDIWDFPGLHKINMNTMIATQPTGYAVEYFLEGQSVPFKSTLIPTREAVIDQLDFFETWGHGILELRKLMK